MKTSKLNKSPLPEFTIGLDLGDKKHAICVLDAHGEPIDQRTITNHRESLRRLAKKYPNARIAMEVGACSPWISRQLSDLGMEVIVANPRKLRAIYQNDRKSDEQDALMLARLARVAPNLLYPIQHGCEEAQRDLLRLAHQAARQPRADGRRHHQHLALQPQEPRRAAAAPQHDIYVSFHPQSI